MTKMKQETNYVTRPKTKPDESFKGKLNKWDNGYAEFIPQGTRENQRQMLKQLGDSSFYKTEGKKDSSYSLHLNVNGQSVDPVAEMEELFHTLTAAERKQAPKMEESATGRMLYEDMEKHLQVWLDKEKHEVTIMAHLNCAPDVERQLLQLQSDMGRIVGRYRTEIINNHNK